MPGLPCYRGIPNRSIDGPGLAELHPADLGQENLRQDTPPVCVLGRQVELDRFGVRKAQAGLVPVLFLEGRQPRRVGLVKRRPDCPIQKLERPLQRVNGHLSQKPVVLAVSPLCQEPGKLLIREQRGPGLQPPLLQGQRFVPNQPRTSPVTDEILGLSVVGSKRNRKDWRISMFLGNTWSMIKSNETRTG